MPLRFFSPRHLRNKVLFWFLLISVLAIAGITGLAFWHMSSVQVDDELEQLGSLRDIIKEHVLEEITHHINVANSAATQQVIADALVGRASHEDASAFLRNLRSTFKQGGSHEFDFIHLVNTGGRVIASSGNKPIGKEIPLRAARALSGENGFAGPYHSKAVLGLRHVIAYAPVWEGDKVVGAIIAPSKLDHMVSESGSRGFSRMFESGETYLVGIRSSAQLAPRMADTYRKMMTGSRFMPGTVDIPVDTRAVEACIKGQAGEQVIDDYRGVRVLSAFAPIEGTGWCIIAEMDEEEALGAVYELRDLLVLSGLAYLLVAALASTMVSRGLTSSISRLRQGAIFIGSGHLDHKIDIKTGDEIEELAGEFNRMGEQLWESYSDLEQRVDERTMDLSQANEELDQTNEELSQTNEHLLMEIQERQRIEEHLKSAQQQAEAASRAKGDFLANMSHEIRTPMNGIMGMLELLNDTDLARQQREYSEMAYYSAESLMSVINAVLDISKIEAGQLALEPRTFDLHGFIESMLKQMGFAARENEINITKALDKDLPTHILGDEGKLRQVIINLMGNAIKFTDKGEVCLRVMRLKGEAGETETLLRFEVSDTGIGIPEEHIRHIFDSFRQADSSISRKFGGTGLGLAISTSLVELMGGEINVQSTVGKGSTFGFTLKAGLEDVRQDGPVSCLDNALPTGSLTILLAEDNTINQKIALRFLQRAGHIVTVASNGIEAVRKYRGGNFDIVLMDVQMPQMDGFEATSEIRRIERDNGRHIPVIALTAHAYDEDRQRCLDAGMDDYIAKPINTKLLNRIIRKMTAPGKNSQGAPLT